MPELPEIIRLDLTPDEYSLLAQMLGIGGMFIGGITSGSIRHVEAATTHFYRLSEKLVRSRALLKAEVGLMRKVTTLVDADEEEKRDILTIIDALEKKISS